MTGSSATRVTVVRRPGFRVEYAVGARVTREEGVELDLTAVIVLAGRCDARVGEMHVERLDRGAIFVNPGANLSLDGRGDSGPYEHIAITLRPAEVDTAASSAGLGAGAVVLFGVVAAALSRHAELSARRLALELCGESSPSGPAVELAARLLAHDLIRAYGRVDATDRIERSRVGLVDRRVRRAVEFMHDNYERDLAVGEIAAEAYLSEFHFARLFRRVTGQTPHGYLASVRIEAAERLLAETDLGVAEVGARVGYSSASHFTKVFRAASGLTPTAFREALVR